MCTPIGRCLLDYVIAMDSREVFNTFAQCCGMAILFSRAVTKVADHLKESDYKRSTDGCMKINGIPILPVYGEPARNALELTLRLIDLKRMQNKAVYDQTAAAHANLAKGVGSKNVRETQERE